MKLQHFRHLALISLLSVSSAVAQQNNSGGQPPQSCALLCASTDTSCISCCVNMANSSTIASTTCYNACINPDLQQQAIQAYEAAYGRDMEAPDWLEENFGDVCTQACEDANIDGPANLGAQVRDFGESKLQVQHNLCTNQLPVSGMQIVFTVIRNNQKGDYQ